jgi:hypothetical protein
MNEQDRNDALDARLASLPQELAPRRDLWPEISARMRAVEAAQAQPATRPAGGLWRQLAAAVVLVTLSSLVTYFVVGRQQLSSEHTAAVELVQHELSAARFLPAGYVQARQELSAAFDDSLARLSPQTRAVVEDNLRDIERSLRQINAALAQDPGNATLQQLLLAASAQELQYLDEVRRLALNLPSKGA